MLRVCKGSQRPLFSHVCIIVPLHANVNQIRCVMQRIVGFAKKLSSELTAGRKPCMIPVTSKEASPMDPTKRRIRKIDRDAQRFVAQALGNASLSLSDYDMIHTVRHRPGITQEELRKLYCLDKSTIARRAAKLEADGYLQRRPHPEDGRRKQLYVTAAGAALRDAKVEAESFFFQWLTADLTPAELDVLCPLLDRLQLRSHEERRQAFCHLLESYAAVHGGHSVP